VREWSIEKRFFGLVDTFAIEISSYDSVDKDSSTINHDTIHFHYWINGKKSAGGGGHINDIYYSMRHLGSDSVLLSQQAFCEAASKDVFEVLDARINQRPTSLAKLASAVPDDFLKFSLWFHHIFGHMQFFLIDCGDESRLIYGEANAGFRGQVVAPIESFVAIKNINELAPLELRTLAASTARCAQRGSPINEFEVDIDQQQVRLKF
jgi:hypothetical protein